MTNRKDNPQIGRRPLIAATATGGLAVAGLAVANRMGVLGSDGEPGAGAVLQLQETSRGVRSLEYPLGEDVLPSVGRAQWRTAELPTSTHSMVAVTWRDPKIEPVIEVNSRRAGVWQGWQRLAPLHDIPNVATPTAGGGGDGGGGTDATDGSSAGGLEGNGRSGTDLAWIGPADGVRIRLSGQRPRDLRLVLLYPAPSALLTPRVAQRRRASAEQLKPALLTRRDWDADPAWRDGSPSYNSTIEQVHVHHTVNSNDYAADDVPGLIRGMYSYHTRSLGWSDIAYNFLVDRFGRTWVGRAGGPDKLVRGAHTLGFNATSAGVAAIGNYDTAKPSAKLLAAIAQLAAWKLAPYGRDPQGRVAVASEGSDRYRTGTRPRLPVIDGHRDTNDTACPGANLYAALPTIRELAKRNISGTPAVQVVEEPTLSGSAVVDKTLTVQGGRSEPAAQPTYAWRRDGTTIAGATTSTYTCTSTDVGSVLSAVLTYSASGHEPAQRTLTAPGPVRARPVIDVDAVSDRDGVTVTVRVSAQGGKAAPTGTVIVSLPKRQRSVVMETGQVQVRFPQPLTRPRTVVVKYAGNAEILSGTATTTVEMANGRR